MCGTVGLTDAIDVLKHVVGLVGILNVDVDGSFGGASGSQDLDNLQPSYFVDLTQNYGFLQLSQFGVYG